MEQLNNGSLDPSKLNLDSKEFLTPEQIPNDVKINAFPRPNAIPDLDPNTMNANLKERKAVLEGLQSPTAALKKEIMEEMANEELRDSKPSLEKIPDNPKDALKFLIAKGDFTKTIRMYGSNWTLRALDQRDITLALDNIKMDMESETARMSALMFIQVVYSIEAINGISIYEWFPEVKRENYNKKEEYILAVKNQLKVYLEHVPPYVIDSFYTEYSAIENERAKLFAELKNS